MNKLSAAEWQARIDSTHGQGKYLIEELAPEGRNYAQIVCAEHGRYLGSVYTLSRGGTSCRLCASDSTNKTKLAKSLSHSLSVLEERFADQLVYISGYSGMKNACTFRCHVHGKFERDMETAISSKFPCPKCRWENTRTENDAAREARWKLASDKYRDRYKFTKYCQGTMRCKCLKHGIVFNIRPTNSIIDKLLNGRFNSCPECVRDTRSLGQQKSQADFRLDLRTRHGDDIQLIGQYTGAKSQAKFKCAQGHVWHAGAEALVRTKFSGCPRCAGTVSSGETQLFKWVRKYFPDARQSVRQVYSARFSQYLEWDIFIPSIGVAIEYNGMYWHSYPGKHRLYHWEKSNISKEHGVRLLHIYETDWINRPALVKATILHLLGKTTRRVYARSLSLRSAPGPTEAIKSFYTRTHLLGAPISGISYALIDRDAKIKAVMTFASIQSERGSSSGIGVYELVRFSTSGHVVGAASRLWTAFLRERGPTRVVSYSDNDLFDGRVYGLLGFKSTGAVRPEYKTLWGGRLRHKSYTRRANLSKLLGSNFDPNLSEMQNLLNNNKIVIYDSGKTKWEWTQT